MNYTKEELDNLPYILEMNKEGLRRLQCPEPDENQSPKQAPHGLCPNCRIFAEQFTQIQDSLQKYLERKVALIMRTFQARMAQTEQRVNAITTRYLRETIRGDQQESLLEQTPQPFRLTGTKPRSLENSLEQKHFGNADITQMREPNTTSRTRIIPSPEHQNTDLDTLRKQIDELRSHLVYAHKEQEADTRLKEEHQTTLENILKLKEENKRLKGENNKYRSELESALLELGEIKSILMNLSRG